MTGRIELLGRIAVHGTSTGGGRLPGRRADLVFAYLAAEHRRIVTQDELADALWPDTLPDSWAAALRGVVSEVRRYLEEAGLGQAAVITSRRGYQLQLPSDVIVDLDEVRDDFHGARCLLDAGDGAGAAVHAARAASTARLPFLPNHDGDWVDGIRRELESIHARALEVEARGHRAAGDLVAAAAAAEQLVVAEPFSEAGHQLRIRILAEAGDRAGAIRAYEHCRAVLAEELGVEPSAETEAALQAAKRGEDVRPKAASLDRAPTAASTARRPMAVPSEPQMSLPRSVLVGRAGELRRVRAALDRATAGSGGVVLVSGEPGVGKTRLMEELAHEAARTGAVVAWGRCYPRESAPPFWPWTQALRTIVADAATGTDEEMAGVTQLVPGLKDAATPVGHALADPARARFQLCQDVATFIGRVAASQCIVVILDDLHWADPASLELLGAVVFRLAGSRLLVAGTYLDVEAREGHPLVDALATMARALTAERVRLAGMTEADCAQFIAAFIGVEPPAAFVHAVHARTDGNPFFVTELLRLLEDEGSLARPIPEVALHSPVPVGVRDVITHRFARLSETARHLMTIAAVVGREFDHRVLDLAGGVTDEEALGAVEMALAHGLISESEEAVGRYRFSHALIRETIYAGISGLRRARLHARVAQALEDLPDDGDTNLVADLAHHFAKAAPAGGAEKAFRYAIAAADSAAEQLAYERAEEHLRRGVEMVAALPAMERGPAELRALARLGALLAATRGQASPEVRAVFERASKLCRQGDCGRDAVTALWGYFYSCYVRGELDDARAVARKMLETSDTGSGQEVVMGGHLAMGIASFHGGQLTTARRHLLAAIETADEMADPSLAGVFQVDPSVYARSFFALVLALIGESHQAQQAARDARSRAAQTGQPFTIATAAMFSAWLGFVHGDAPSAGEHATTTVALAETHGFPLLAAAGKAFEGWALVRRGELDAAAARVASGLAAFRSGPGPLRQSLFVAVEAEVVYLTGDPERALTLLDEALAAAEAAEGQHYFEAALHRLRAEILLTRARGRTDEARDSLGRAVAIAREQGADVLVRQAEAQLEALRLGATAGGVVT
ncbi:MAG: AAA family ATPase [Actinomycetota bacterium]|nr:AAA family ATPase [Actinomycetota bacterium]